MAVCTTAYTRAFARSRLYYRSLIIFNGGVNNLGTYFIFKGEIKCVFYYFQTEMIDRYITQYYIVSCKLDKNNIDEY